jgi:putative oligomerization/nucleic acid binding protein
MFGPSRRVARRTARRTSRRQMAMYQNQQGGYDDGGYDEPAPQQSAPPPPAAPAEPDYVAELSKLAHLKDQGIISQEEFDAKKKQILGI